MSPMNSVSHPHKHKRGGAWGWAAAVLLLALSLCLAAPRGAAAYDNGLGATPPMGWNTWCTDDICGLFDICTDALVREQARAMVDLGMPALGYTYVNMDDCWSAATRDADGNLQPNAERFPFGMKALADYVHSLGLKIGLYTCIGTKTCRGGLPGSFGSYDKDAATLAEWGIDFVKADNCHRPSGYTERELYANFSRHLNATGRPMLFSLCEWGNGDVQQWGAEVGQMFRIQMDHLPFWDLPTHAAGMGFGQGTLNIIEYVATLKPSTFVRQFGWMDPDFLMTLFWPTMPFTYSRSEFSFWALWSSPLIVATKISNMSTEKRSILLNRHAISVNQDTLATAGDRFSNHSDGGQVWAKPLSTGEHAVLLFNANPSRIVNITVTWSKVGVVVPLPGKTLSAIDVWGGPSGGGAVISSLPVPSFTVALKPADVLFLIVGESGAVHRRIRE